MHPLSVLGSTNLIVPFHEVPSRQWFVNALDSLQRYYRFVDLDEIQAYADGRADANNLCHVTFDDGHASFFTEALPVLRERRIPATLFVSPKVIAEHSNYWFQELAELQTAVGDDAIRAEVAATFKCPPEPLSRFALFSIFVSLPIAAIRRILTQVIARARLAPCAPFNMTLAQLRESARSGVVTVGAHTVNHPVLANETDEDAECEIRDSIANLSDLLDRPVDRFAYPNGTEGLDFTTREQRLLKTHGVNAAVTTDSGFVRKGADRLALPRGGCPSLEGDSALVRAARIVALPVWTGLRSIARPASVSQAEERRSIRSLGIL